MEKNNVQELTPMFKQFIELKKKHPDALLLFRCGDFYETYAEDAQNAANVLGITLTKSSKSKDAEGKPLAMAGFPYHALDTYLPKLIRSGFRVAICDKIDKPVPEAKKSIRDDNDTVVEKKPDDNPKRLKSMPLEDLKQLYYKIYMYDERLPELFDLIAPSRLKNYLVEKLSNEQL